MLTLNNIEVIYDNVILVLKGVSINVREGGITTLLGANGAGKTTTLKAKPDGKITGEDVKKGFEKINNFTLGGLVPPLKVTPQDHEGGGLIQIWQVKGGKFVKVTDWFAAYQDVVAKHIKESGKKS